jgi:secondary thiamine-phosphate synthase enzyme
MMAVKTKSIQISTRGFCDVVDITDKVGSVLDSLNEMREGTVTLFVPGSTAGLTTIEYESGCIEDLKAAFERFAPQDGRYAHNARWGDGNGFSHTRAALLGPSLQIPFAEKRLLTGTWQQIILVDFDNRPRHREVILQFLGE